MSAELRIGDAERDASVAALGEHFAAGRLTKEEYDERAGVAWTARTVGDLAALFDDLPAPHPERTRPAVEADAWPTRPRRRRGLWPAPIPVVVIAVVVGLVVLSGLPWFVLAIVAWFVFVGLVRGGWHGGWQGGWQGRRGWQGNWHDYHGGWRRRPGWR